VEFTEEVEGFVRELAFVEDLGFVDNGKAIAILKFVEGGRSEVLMFEVLMTKGANLNFLFFLATYQGALGTEHLAAVGPFARLRPLEPFF